MWAVYALGAAVLTSFNPLLYKRLLKEAGSAAVVWGVTLLALPLLGLFAFALTPQMPRLDALFFMGVLGSAILNTGAFLATAKALRMTDVSIVAPLLVFSPVFTLLIGALFLDEVPSARGLAGAAVVLAGAYWLQRRPGAHWLEALRAPAREPGIALVLLAGLLWAVTPLFEKVAIQHTVPESPQFTALAATALLTLLLTPAVAAGGWRALPQLSRHRREWLLASLIAGAAPVLGYAAYSLGLVGYVTTLFRLSAVLTVIWGRLFLNEGELARRLPAAVTMAAGAVLIST